MCTYAVERNIISNQSQSILTVRSSLAYMDSELAKPNNDDDEAKV